MTDRCANCVQEKPAPLTHCKCEKCGNYRPLNPRELAKVKARR